MEPAVVDDVIGRLLEVRTGTWRQVQLSESEIRGLCVVAGDIFLQQPNLLELEAPMKVCGDIHGQYFDLLRLFEYGGYPPQTNYVFMGNYVDYGKQSLETMCLLLAYKIKYPENFFLLRGNHEDSITNRMYGFYDECKRRYNVRLWKVFADLFNCLPVAALIDEKVLCVHGGLSPDLHNLDQIRSLPRPTDVPLSGLLCDLLWSDPSSDIQGWEMNERGVSYTFGPDKVSEFLARHDLDLICRSNQIVEDGYEFFADRQLVTIFSAPSFLGEYDNAGAMMSIDENLMCSFQIMMPADRKFKFSDASTNSSKFPSGTRFGSMATAKPGNTSNGGNNIAESTLGTWTKAAKSISSLWGPSVGSRTTVKPENTSTGGKGVVERAPDAHTDAAKSVSSPTTSSSDNTTMGRPGNTPTSVNTGIGSTTSNQARPSTTAMRHGSPGGNRAVHFRVGEYVGQSAKAVTRAVSPFNPERDGRRR